MISLYNCAIHNMFMLAMRITLTAFIQIEIHRKQFTMHTFLLKTLFRTIGCCFWLCALEHKWFILFEWKTSNNKISLIFVIYQFRCKRLRICIWIWIFQLNSLSLWLNKLSNEWIYLPDEFGTCLYVELFY